MGKFIDLTGHRFGRLVVISRVDNINGEVCWLCRCDCGNEKKIKANNLRNGHTRSCGCLNSDAIQNNRKSKMMGKRFGKLVVVGYGRTENGLHKWECRCDCGNTYYLPSNSLTSGKTKSCGCLKREKAIEVFTTHGKSKERIHKEWRGILHRCKNPTASHYENYGGRGISVCEEWRGENGFVNFYNWSMENGYSDDLTLDRKDNDKGYSPDNCRWVTHMENCRNRGTRKDNLTGSPGVQIVKLRSGGVKYRSSITANYKRINLGNFDTLEEAVKVRKEAEEKYWNKKEGD